MGQSQDVLCVHGTWDRIDRGIEGIQGDMWGSPGCPMCPWDLGQDRQWDRGHPGGYVGQSKDVLCPWDLGQDRQWDRGYPGGCGGQSRMPMCPWDLDSGIEGIQGDMWESPRMSYVSMGLAWDRIDSGRVGQSQEVLCVHGTWDGTDSEIWGMQGDRKESPRMSRTSDCKMWDVHDIYANKVNLDIGWEWM